MPIPVVITAFADRTFTFITQHPARELLHQAGGQVDKGNPTPGRTIAGQISVAQCREIAEAEDEGHERQRPRGGNGMIVGSARSMGLQVVE